MFFGNCVCVATWAVYIVVFPDTYYHFKYTDIAYVAFRGPPSAMRVNSRFTIDEIMSLLASGLTHQAAWQFLYSIDFSCLCATKLMVLDRMNDFVSLSLKYRSVVIARWVVLAIVTAGCLVGVCGSIASAVSRTRAASIANQASTAARQAIALPLSTKRTEANRKALDLWKQSYVYMEEAGKTDSIFQFSEMVLLVLLVVCFLVLGILCARRVSSFLRSLSPKAALTSDTKYLHKQIVSTAAVVFVTFLPRAVFSSMRAVSGALQDISYDGQADCPIFCSDISLKADLYTSGCKKPFNQYSHLTFYLLFTPEFQMIVVLISSSLAQLVALWGMTSIRMRQAFSNISLNMMLITPVESSLPVTH